MTNNKATDNTMNQVISGKLKGKYKTLLAANSRTRQRLWAILSVEEDNAWYQRFKVEIGESYSVHNVLSKAIRAYDCGSLN